MKLSSYTLATFLSVVLCLITILWVIYGLGGLGRSSSQQLLNWHPVLAIIATVVLIPQASLTWRRNRDAMNEASTTEEADRIHFRTKIWHGVLMVSAFILINIAITFAFLSHLRASKPHLYSLHSWIGVAVLILLKGNIFGGLLAAVFPYVRKQKVLSNVHKVFGLAGMAMAFMTVILGFAEIQLFQVKTQGNSYHFVPLMAGVLGALSLGLSVVFMELLVGDTYSVKANEHMKVIHSDSSEIDTSSQMDAKRRNGITVC